PSAVDRSLSSAVRYWGPRGSLRAHPGSPVPFSLFLPQVASAGWIAADRTLRFCFRASLAVGRQRPVDTLWVADYTEKTHCARPFERLSLLGDPPQARRTVPRRAPSCQAATASRRRTAT